MSQLKLFKLMEVLLISMIPFKFQRNFFLDKSKQVKQILIEVYSIEPSKNLQLKLTELF